MRALPNMRVADPGDDADLRAIMRAAVEVQGPVYFRIARLALPAHLWPDHAFAWGRGVTLRAGQRRDPVRHRYHDQLLPERRGLARCRRDSARRWSHLGSIKPIDRDLIVDIAARTGCAVTAENATINGGFGAAVAEVLGEECPVPLQRIGVRDRWVDSGGIKELFTHHGMQPEDIAAAAKKVIAQKKAVRA